MSEIDKMYKNAGIKKVRQTAIAGGDYPIAVGFEDYPPFTAEKQIELIKYIALNNNIDYVKYYYQSFKGVWVFVCVTVTELASETPRVYGAYHEEFKQALAGLINDLWQDLTEAERAEIKNILQEDNQ